jgi:hypothetical protein
MNPVPAFPSVADAIAAVDGFPVERLPGQWVSVFDRLDLVVGFAHRWPVITSVRAAR